MNTDLVVKAGSVMDVARGGNVALAMMDVKVVLICDRSGSMTACDAQGGRARYMVEDEIVARLQKKYPGKIALISFNDFAELCPNGELPQPTGGTSMEAGIDKARPIIEIGAKGILVTDGEPNSETAVFQSVAGLSGKLDTVFVGNDNASGKAFMERLAKFLHGSFSSNSLKNPELLEQKITQLLLSAG